MKPLKQKAWAIINAKGRVRAEPFNTLEVYDVRPTWMEQSLRVGDRIAVVHVITPAKRAAKRGRK